jgi:hypothetical protein
LTTVTLGEEVEEIESGEFSFCESLGRIVIPRAVTTIHDDAFMLSSNLTNVLFCDKIQDFVSKDMCDWWNHGVHEKSLSTYGFLIRCDIPQRLGLVVITSWLNNIHGMLRRIPSVNSEDLATYFDSIDSKLYDYEILSDVPMLLELVIPSHDIVLRVLSYL